MRVTIDLPDDISESLRSHWGNVSRRALEALAAEGYRTGVLTETQITRLLGFESRFQAHALLKEHRVPYRYSEADVQDDLLAHRELGIPPKR